MTRTTSTATAPATSRQADPTASATIALTVLTVATAVGMGRLFENRDFLVPFLSAALVAHWLAWLSRRYDISLPVALPLSLVGVLVVAAWTIFPHTTAFGIPWSGTFNAIVDACRLAWTDFATVVAPAPASKGFLFAGALGIGVAALLADWAAFRVRAVFEAAIPSFTLFVFTAVLGADDYRGLSVAAYLAALFLFLLVHQAGMATESASWFASRAKGGMGALLQGGALLGTVAIVAALVLGPNLPGSDADPIIAWRDADGSGPSSRTTVSPLVDIRGRLVEQSNVELFTVRSNQPAYWRLTSLKEFDGNIWQSKDNYRDVGRGLPQGVPVTVERATLTQEFTITALSSIWLPAAYRPARIEGIDASFNADSGSLITDAASTDGFTYTVTSEMPRPTAAQLDAAPPLTGDRLDEYLKLPSIPGRVQRLAVDLTRNQPTAYDKAKAMQDWFQKNFTYDLKARPGHDGRALERFLFESRRGYCEQFAGAFAVMARAIGLPARVAVGFTPGEVDSEGRYHVRGLNAHAWPEVYIDGYGWVYFEATPDRGMPGATWTQLPPQQARLDNPAEPAPITTTTTVAPAGPDDNTPATTPEDGETDVSTSPEAPDRSPLRNPLVQVVVAALVVAAATAIGVPLLKRSRRARRRAEAGDVSRRVLVAWTEAEEALASVGAARRPSETIDEYAVRAPKAAALPVPATTALHELAHDTTIASYAPTTPTAETVRRATASAATIERALQERSTVRQRVWRGIDPRPLLPTSELRATRASLVSRVRKRLGR
ncbi:MAG TPA: DUF3488 and transglutaminase-like domain-containing protein [Acidimicrobiales bacterium]|nr:DUF3488 and transglutaminase-like domain-containing protein [Acidimicrobiales bacterium]